jgi:hypothetical protein
MEGHDEHGKATLLRGTVSSVQVAHGEVPGLQVPTEAQANLHRGRQKAEDLGVQAAHETKARRDANTLVRRLFLFHLHLPLNLAVELLALHDEPERVT